MFNPPPGTTGKKMRTKTLKQIESQAYNMMARCGGSDRHIKINTILRIYRNNIYSHLDNMLGESWANTTVGFEYGVITPVPASVYAKQV